MQLTSAMLEHKWRASLKLHFVKRLILTANIETTKIKPSC